MQFSMSSDYGYAAEEVERTLTLRMAEEGRVVVRVANPLKAATTVTSKITCLVFVRAAPGYALLGPTRTSYLLNGGLKPANELSAEGTRKKRNAIKTPAEIVPFHPTHKPTNNMHPSLAAHKVHHVDSTGEHLVNLKVAEKQVPKLKAEKEKITADLDESSKQLKLYQDKVIQLENKVRQADSTCEVDGWKKFVEAIQFHKKGINEQPPRTWLRHVMTSDNAPRFTFVLDGVNYTLVAKAIVEGDTAKPMYTVRVGSQRWKDYRDKGCLLPDWDKEAIPLTQAPTKDYQAQSVSLGGVGKPFQVMGNYEELKLLDVLKRPVMVKQDLQIEACGQGKDVTATLSKDDIYHCYSLPIFPPQLSHIDPTNKSDKTWDQAIIVSPHVAILSMFRHWVGSNRYTIVARGGSQQVIYVTFVPNTGVIKFGDLAQSAVTVATDPFYKGGFGSTGLITEMIIPQVNPSNQL